MASYFSFDLVLDSVSEAFEKLVFITNHSQSEVYQKLASYKVPIKQKNIDYLTICLMTKTFNDNNRKCLRTLVLTIFSKIDKFPHQVYFRRTNYFDTQKVSKVGFIRITGSELYFSGKFRPAAFDRKSLFQEKITYKPLTKFIASVKMPYYFHEPLSTLLPGSSFFIIADFESSVSEKIWLSQFNKIFARQDLKFLAERPIEESVYVQRNAIYFIADTIADVVYKYPYISDIEESFDDIFFNHGGDCEDYAKGVLMVFKDLKKVCDQTSNLFLKSVGVILKPYTAFAVLGTVRTQSYENHLSAFSNSFTEQAHMYAMLISEERCVTIECTAALAYTIASSEQIFQKFRLPLKYYKLYKFEDHRGFYQKIVYLYNPDAYLKNKTTAFLVVDPRRKTFGVDYQMFVDNWRQFKLLPDNAYRPEVQKFIETQLTKFSFTKKLPLSMNYEKIIYKTKEGIGFSSMIIFIDKKDFVGSTITDLYKRVKILSIVEENKFVLRFHIKI